MLTLEQNCREPEAAQASGENTIELVLPTGLLGFESSTRFHLVSPADIAPYQWLEGLNGAFLSFLVIPAGYAIDNYRLELSDEDTKSLGLKNPADASLLNIATYRKDGTVTVNLRGPIVYHRHTRIGRQVVPINAADLPLSHTLD